MPHSKSGTGDSSFIERASTKFCQDWGPRLGDFSETRWSLHDGTLTRMEVGDHIDQIWGGGTGDIVNRRKLRVRLFVLADVVKRRRIIGNRWYVLEYTKVERIDLNFPGKLKLFAVGFDTNFGDWGYDELTSPKQSLFRHEILFSSGATVTIDFRNCSVRRKPARNVVRIRESPG